MGCTTQSKMTPTRPAPVPSRIGRLVLSQTCLLLTALLLPSCDASRGLAGRKDAGATTAGDADAKTLQVDAVAEDAAFAAGNLSNVVGAECKLPPDPGSCSDSVERYYYDQNQNECFSFSYTGCGGNDNNFLTYSRCRVFCGGELMCTCPQGATDCSVANGCAACPISSNYAGGTECNDPGLYCNDGIPCSCGADLSGKLAWTCTPGWL